MSYVEFNSLPGKTLKVVYQTDNDVITFATEDGEEYQLTFYRIGTAKGTVVIRWYDSSNGYYSESVSFRKV